MDRSIRAAQARATQGLSPMSIAAPWADWAFHLARAPGKQMALALRAQMLATRYALWLARAASNPGAPPIIEPDRGDRRFADPSWSVWPFNAVQQAYLLAESWWLEAAKQVPGVTRRHEQQVGFMARQLADLVTNIPWLNPTILATTLHEGGTNLLRGYAMT